MIVGRKSSCPTRRKLYEFSTLRTCWQNVPYHLWLPSCFAFYPYRPAPGPEVPSFDSRDQTICHQPPQHGALKRIDARNYLAPFEARALKQSPAINYVGHGHKRCEHLEANIHLVHLRVGFNGLSELVVFRALRIRKPLESENHLKMTPDYSNLN